MRILEIPVNSDLNFQMLLYYHGYYNILYALILIPSGLYQLMVFKTDQENIIKFIMTTVFCITEIWRFNFGYMGNINESFPELIAFLILTFLFSLVFVILPLTAEFKAPHEDAMYLINLLFLVSELILGVFLCMKFSNTMTAAYYRRTAPILDKKFKKKYDNAYNSNHPRAVPIGMRRLKETEDSQFEAFAESNAKMRVLSRKERIDQTESYVED